MSFVEAMEEKARIIDGVRERFPEVEWPTPVKEPIWTGRFDKKPIEGWYALRDQNNQNLFQFVSDDYALVFNEEIVDKAVTAVDELGDTFGEPKFAFKFFKDGARFKLNITFPDAQKNIALKDPVAPTLSLKNCYDKSRKFIFERGAMELVCTNGLVVPRFKDMIQKKHIGDFDVPDIKQELVNFIEGFDHTTAIWQKWTQTKIDKFQVAEIWEAMPFSEKEREKIEALPLIGDGKTLGSSTDGSVLLWDLNRATTQYLTHEMKSSVRADEAGPIIANIISKYSN